MVKRRSKLRKFIFSFVIAQPRYASVATSPGFRIVVASLSIINQGAAMRANSGTIYKRVYEHGSEQGIAI